MSRVGLSSFASGILFATVIVGTVYYFFTEPTVTYVQSEISNEEMIRELKLDGYIITTQKDNRSNQADSEEKLEDKPAEVVHSQDVYTLILKITPGMTTTEVAEQLTQGRILEDEQIFLDYMNVNNLNTSIHIGIFELRSDMSVSEIADIIT